MTDPFEQHERRLERELARAGNGGLFDRLPRHRPFPRLGDGVVRSLDLVHAYAELTALALDRVKWLGELIDEQLGMSRERAELIRDGADPEADEAQRHMAELRLGGPDGLAGIIGYTYTALVVERTDCAEDPPEDDDDGGHRRRFGKHQHVEMHATGEAVRPLWTLEAQERDRAERLVRNGLKIGVEAQAVEAMRAYGDTLAIALRLFADELGVDPDDVAVSRVAARAVLRARIEQGANEGDPDVDGGLPLTVDERQRVLARALPSGDDT